ncbi:MAG: SlyX family protein [Agarilytica sp.]
MNEEKVIELESRLAFQEDMLEGLNKHIASQENEIIVLHRQLQHLNSKIKSLENAVGEADDENVPPPHY